MLLGKGVITPESRFHMVSLWEETYSIAKRGELTGNLSTEVAVIGAGIAGILTAYYLTKRGIQTIVVEANRIGSGQTKGTTAKITSQHEDIYHKLIEQFGEEKAKQYAFANEHAIAEYKNLVSELQIDCDFEEKSSYLYTLEDTTLLQEEAISARKLGIDSEYITETELPFQVKGAVKFANQAQFHPLKFLSAVAENLTIYENTKVLEVEDNILRTNRGEITAKYIVFACHYPFINAPGFYFLRMHQDRSYFLACKNATTLNGMYRSLEKTGYSLRCYKDVLLFGGGSHRTGENSHGGQYSALRSALTQFYPEAKEFTHWSAQDCMTLDGVPYIGQFSSGKPNWYVATGFGKWGMTSSMVSAQLISSQIAGEEVWYAPVFSPERFTPKSSAKALLDEGMHAIKGLTRRIFQLPKATEEELPLGHGGIIEVEEEKYGVYKNEKGEIFIISPKCPHLGCQLEWNPDELSFDCPCHGSRFTYTGELIDNPAQTDVVDKKGD